MFQFVYWLRAIAAILITNAHYADIWPLSSLAFGGHLGNCIYFFLSGFCLYDIKEKFPKWYAKRIIRIYPALWIVNIVDLIVGRTSVGGFWSIVHCFVYPTWFHFIGSIMLIYILYYVIRFIQGKYKIDIRWFMLISLLVFVTIYCLAFDKTYYHIDDINENWVRFMFIESMLIGAWFREKYSLIQQKITGINVAGFLGLTVLYFMGKKLFSHFQILSVVQCFLPIIVVLYLSSIAVLFIKLEKRGFFKSLNNKLNVIVEFIAGITLEIYLGQEIILWKLTNFVFPVNFILVTACIVFYAWIIHKCSGFIQRKCIKLIGA